MGSLGVELGEPSFTKGVGRFEHNQWVAGFPVLPRHSLWQAAELTSGDKFNELDGRLWIVDVDYEDPAGEDGKFGWIRFYEGGNGSSRGYGILLKMAEADRAKLVTMIQSGVPLRGATLFFPHGGGIEPGWSRTSKWDNVAHPVVHLDGYRLTFGQLAEEERDVVESVVTPREIAHHEIDRVLRETARLNETLKIGLIAICALLLAGIVL